VRPSALRNRVSMMRYESRRNFRELRLAELRRIPLLRGWVNKRPLVSSLRLGGPLRA
jgi:hypothetical protein